MRVPINAIHPVVGVPNASAKGGASDDAASDAIANQRAIKKTIPDTPLASEISEGSAATDRNPDGRLPWSTHKKHTKDSKQHSAPNSIGQYRSEQGETISGISISTENNSSDSNQPLEASGQSLDYQA